jgi:hypothetical protein
MERAAVIPDFCNPHVIPTDEERALYVPQEMHAFEPQHHDVYIIATTSKQRMMFHSVHALEPEEEKHLEEFRGFITANNLTMPPGYDDDGRLALRFLEGVQFKYKEAH